MLSQEEKKQYHRHIILEEFGQVGQEKLKSAKVLVVGAGGLGCPVLQYLTAAGVGTIGIVDFDVVDQSNLQRQVLYTIADIGKSKAERAASRLAALNPFVNFKVHNYKLDRDNAEKLFAAYDLIVDGSDNFSTRYLVNDTCVLTNKPLVFGSIFKFQGQVSVFNYNNGPTYRCLFPEPPGPYEVPNCAEVGVIGVLPGIIGALQANEAIKLITGVGDILNGALLYFDALTMNQQIVKFAKNENIKITKLEEDYDVFCGIVENKDAITEISTEEFKSNPQKYTVLDVRTEQEFQQFNIGGVHIPLAELEQRYTEINTKLPVVVCCQSGVRSKKAIQLLQSKLPDIEVLNLIGGLASY
ncbi:molybdopterin-synthase adenylyltransferase MoeB [Aquimarina brevivitae]|uniref:Molybdopterin-synthase adenylyltransferase n=1 Tax=Aquimarina brevivitae TaxID=323412 RepID=A0A4V2F7F2_9FLAO|nr:molybdopterin-synthase adenylyltransferase MoeB [Aquimarina brevivitae]RZS99609.1 adenylyltransferase/sulfurtransferase [Aquimarina brevivitae]